MFLALNKRAVNIEVTNLPKLGTYRLTIPDGRPLFSLLLTLVMAGVLYILKFVRVAKTA